MYPCPFKFTLVRGIFSCLANKRPPVWAILAAGFHTCSTSSSPYSQRTRCPAMRLIAALLMSTNFFSISSSREFWTMSVITPTLATKVVAHIWALNVPSFPRHLRRPSQLLPLGHIWFPTKQKRVWRVRNYYFQLSMPHLFSKLQRFPPSWT